VPHAGIGDAHRGADRGEGLAGLVAAADLLHVEATAVWAVAARTGYLDHPNDVAHGHAEDGGKFLEPAGIEAGRVLRHRVSSLGRQTGLGPVPGYDGRVRVNFNLRAGVDLRACNPADVTDRHPVTGGELVEAAVPKGGQVWGYNGGHRR
jgi:hypothetical protein